MLIGGIVWIVIVSYIAAAAIIELAKEDLKQIHVLAIIIFVFLFSISYCSQRKDKFYRENTNLRNDF